MLAGSVRPVTLRPRNARRRKINAGSELTGYQ
jgi:hypothetical protein